MAASSTSAQSVGIYISPKEICIAQGAMDANGRILAEHLISVPTGFQAKEGQLRPLSINSDFFNEKAAWLPAFKTAVRKIRWSSSRAVITLAPQFAILRYFIMPFVGKRFWSKSIPVESKKYIPVSFDEATYDFHVSQLENGKKLGALFGLTQKKTVEFLLTTLKSSGLEMQAVESSAISLERLFSSLNPKEHESSGYIHFFSGSSLMLLSSGGCPVLYRETEHDGTSTMSERKRLDVKGAMQFVDRYVGGHGYKRFMLSGEGLEVWQPVAAQESTLPVAVWDPAKAAGLKNNSSAAFFAVGASFYGHNAQKPAIDISGFSTVVKLEKQVQKHIWTIAAILGGLILFLSLVSQVKILMTSSKLSALSSQVGDATSELEGSSTDAIMAKIDKIQADVKMLVSLVGDSDVLGPKLQLVADTIPADLWLSSVRYLSPFAASELESTTKELELIGETQLKGEMKIQMVEAFYRGLKSAEEFKIFGPPNGGMEFKTESESGGGSRQSDLGGEGAQAENATGFTIQCTVKRKG